MPVEESGTETVRSWEWIVRLELNLRSVVLERETGFEPATSTLARSHSTS